MDFLFVLLSLVCMILGGTIAFKQIIKFLEDYKRDKAIQHYGQIDHSAELQENKIKSELTMEKLKQHFHIHKIPVAADLAKVEIMSEMGLEGMYDMNKFQEKLKELDFHLASVGEFCELSYSEEGKEEVSCSATYKIVYPKGNVGYITATFSDCAPEYWDIEEKVTGIRNIVFHHNGIDKEFFVDLGRELESLKLERRPFQITRMEGEKVRLYTIQSTLAGLQLAESVFNYKRPTKFNEAYKIKLKVNGQTYNPNAVETLDVLKELVDFPVNIGVTGPVGTGKTTLSYYLTQDMEDACVIAVSSGDLDNILRNSGSIKEFSDLIRQQEDRYSNVIILLDEADKALKTETNISAMNNFLDGNQRKQLGDNVSMILIFNSEISQLPQSIVRPGRMHAVINVGNIHKDKGLKVLQSLADEDKVVDIKGYNDFAKNRNEVSLAEVYQFVLRKSLNDKLQALVSKKLGTPKTPIIMK